MALQRKVPPWLAELYPRYRHPALIAAVRHFFRHIGRPSRPHTGSTTTPPSSQRARTFHIHDLSTLPVATAMSLALVRYLKAHPSSTRATYARTIGSMLIAHIGNGPYASVSRVATVVLPMPLSALQREVNLTRRGLSNLLHPDRMTTAPPPVVLLHWLLRWTAARGSDLTRLLCTDVTLHNGLIHIRLSPLPSRRWMPRHHPQPLPGGHKTDRLGHTVDLVPVPCIHIPAICVHYLQAQLTTPSQTEVFQLTWKQLKAASPNHLPVWHHEAWRRCRSMELCALTTPSHIRQILFGSGSRGSSLPTYLRGLPCRTTFQARDIFPPFSLLLTKQ